MLGPEDDSLSEESLSLSLGLELSGFLNTVLHSHLNELEHKSGGTPKPVKWIVGGATRKDRKYTETSTTRAIKHIRPLGRNTPTDKFFFLGISQNENKDKFLHWRTVCSR